MLYIFIFLTSFLAVTLSIPSIIAVAIKKRLVDAPLESRKVHKRIVPNLGGIAIFSGFLFTACLFIDSHLFPVANQLISAGLILFVIGLKDDIIGVGPLKKLIAQFISASIIAIVADIRIYSMQGFLNMYELNYPTSIFLSVFFIVGVVNAFNLIDGIDGLAGSLGFIVAVLFAYLFNRTSEIGWSYLAIALAGSLVGFLVHNVTPARIFMGDSGSLVIGFLAAVFGIKFLDSSSIHTVMLGDDIQIKSAPALVLSILIVPLFDTVRVFTLRILNNKSPFQADRNHIHHRLLKIGFGHTKATLTLVSITLLFIAISFALQNIGNTQLIALLVLLATITNTLLSFYINQVYESVVPSIDEEESIEAPEIILPYKVAAKKVFQKISEN